MNRQALVIASVGVSMPEALDGITAVEEALSAAAEGYVCVRAFTSPAIRRILRDRGEDVPGLDEALEALAAQGVERVAVQPALLLYGYEYDRLKAGAEALSGRFASLTVGRPLLADGGSIRRLALGLSQDHPAKDGAVTLFMGHGTGQGAHAVYPAVQDAWDGAGRDDLLVGVMEGRPDLDDILRRLEPGGPRNIELLPLMLAAGIHARRDMAGDWRTRLERAGHTVTCSFTGLGRRAWVREMYRERLEELL